MESGPKEHYDLSIGCYNQLCAHQCMQLERAAATLIWGQHFIHINIKHIMRFSFTLYLIDLVTEKSWSTVLINYMIKTLISPWIIINATDRMKHESMSRNMLVKWFFDADVLVSCTKFACFCAFHWSVSSKAFWHWMMLDKNVKENTVTSAIKQCVTVIINEYLSIVAVPNWSGGLLHAVRSELTQYVQVLQRGAAGSQLLYVWVADCAVSSEEELA